MRKTLYLPSSMRFRRYSRTSCPSETLAGFRIFIMKRPEAGAAVRGRVFKLAMWSSETPRPAESGRVPFLRAPAARARARNGKSTRFSRNWPSVRNEHEHEYLCSFSITFVLVLDVRVRKNRTARTLRGSCSNRSQVVRGIFRARTITTFGDRFVLVLQNRTRCGVKRNGRNLVDEHGLRETRSCAYVFHTTRAKRKLRARARTRTRRNGTRPRISASENFRFEKHHRLGSDRR